MTGRVPATAALNFLNLSASDLRSTSHGLGPQANWVVNDNLVFSFSWIHDLYALPHAVGLLLPQYDHRVLTGTTVRCRTRRR